MKKWTIAVYAVSAVGIALFMGHFWHSNSVAGNVLWGIAGACAIFSIYGGIIGRSTAESELGKASLLAATVIGCLILLGVTLSAIFLFVPAL